MALAAIFRFKDNTFRALKIPEGMIVEDAQANWDMKDDVIYTHRFTYDQKTYVRVENVSVGEGPNGKALIFEHDGYVLEGVFNNRLTKERRRISFGDFFPLGDSELMKDAENGDTVFGTYRTIKGNTAYYHKIEFPFTGDVSPFVLPLESDIAGVPILTDYPSAQYIAPVDSKVLLGLSQNFYDHFAFLPVNDNEESARLIGDITLLIDYIQSIDKLNELYVHYGIDSLVLNTNDWDLEVGVSPNFDDSEVYRRQLMAYERKLRHFAIGFNKLIDIEDGETPIANLSLNEIYSIVSYLPSILLQQMSFENRMQLLDAMLKDASITENWNILFLISSGVSAIPFVPYDPSDDEEGIVLKLIRSIDMNDLQEVDGFLNKLLVISKNKGTSNVTIFENLYDKIDDPAFFGIGTQNKRQFVNLVYSLWLNSSYNPYFNLGINDPIAIPYTYKTEEEVEESGGTLAPLILGFDNDTFDRVSSFDFDFEGKKIKVKLTTVNTLDRFGFSNTNTVYGAYDIFQPVSVHFVVNEQFIRIPRINGQENAFVPIFFMKYVDDLNDWENFKTNVGTILDVALTFTGLGNISKLRHLRALSKLSSIENVLPATTRLLRIREVAATVEVTAGAASAIKSGFLDNAICDGDPSTSQFCQQLDYFLLLLELASFSGDIWTKRALKRSADDLLITGVPNDFPVEAQQLLLDLGAEFSDIVATFATKHQGFTDLINQINSLPNATLRTKFAKDFFFKSPQQVLKYYDEFPEAIVYWSNLTDIGKDLVAANAELNIRYFRARPLLREGKFEEVAGLFGKNVGESTFNSSGQRYLEFDDEDLFDGGITLALKSLNDAQVIANRTDDVAIIAANYNIPEGIVQVAKNHYYVNEQLLFDKDKNKFIIGRFSRSKADNEEWIDAINDFLIVDEIESFKRLLVHEYIEAKLVEAGMNFRSFINSENILPYDTGAHFANIPVNVNLELKYTEGLEWGTSIPLPDIENFSNLDDIITQIKDIYQLP